MNKYLYLEKVHQGEGVILPFAIYSHFILSHQRIRSFYSYYPSYFRLLQSPIYTTQWAAYDIDAQLNEVYVNETGTAIFDWTLTKVKATGPRSVSLKQPRRFIFTALRLLWHADIRNYNDFSPDIYSYRPSWV